MWVCKQRTVRTDRRRAAQASILKPSCYIEAANIWAGSRELDPEGLTTLGGRGTLICAAHEASHQLGRQDPLTANKEAIKWQATEGLQGVFQYVRQAQLCLGWARSGHTADFATQTEALPAMVRQPSRHCWVKTEAGTRYCPSAKMRGRAKLSDGRCTVAQLAENAQPNGLSRGNVHVRALHESELLLTQRGFELDKD
jgi:hypothetical protein